MKKISIYICAWVFFACSLPLLHAENADVLKAEEERIALIEKTMQSVIAVFPAEEDRPLGGGSGVIISPDGYALTNFHVVQPCGPAMKCGLPDGKIYDAVVVGLDPAGDIALIKLMGRDDFPHAKIGNSDAVKVGDPSYVMGNPFMLALDFKPCVSYGIISGMHRYQYPAGTFLEYTDCIQTDAAVNPGNSGGPIFNASGELIGIIGRCSFEKRGRVNVGIGYAVSINQTQYFLGTLKSGKIVDHASADMTAYTDGAGKVIIEDLLPFSDLARWGVRSGDEMVRFANRTIDTANTYKNILGIYPKGWKVPVVIRTPDGGRHDVNIRLNGLHGEAELLDMTEKMLEPPIPPEKPRIPGEEKEKKPLEIPIEIPGLQKKMEEAKIPAFIKPVYEKKRGYANFHFNRIELKRVTESWRKGFGTKEPDTGEWLLEGKITGNPDTYKIKIDEDGIDYVFPADMGLWLNDPTKQKDSLHSDPRYHYVAPRGSGGLFAALYLWRLMVTHPKLEFADVTYAGTAPIRGDLSVVYDVLDVYWETVFARFYFSQADGRLVLMEFYSDERRDFPGEIYFNKYVKIDEMLVPSQLEVRYGPIHFGSFDIEKYTPFTEKVIGESIETKEIALIPDPIRAASPEFMDTPEKIIEETSRKIVKIYGAGGLSGLHSYQSGCIISADGLILTVLSGLLEADPVLVILDNGQKFEAKIFAADAKMELAILKIDASELPFFNLPAAVAVTDATNDEADNFGFDTSIKPGDQVLAVSNPFNIAIGNEMVSVQQAVISVRTNLKARRGMFATTYKGPVYVIDKTTNNPGGKGGALVRRDNGQLVGIIGKELRNAENNTWFNFILPTEQVRASIRTMLDPKNESKPLVLISDDAMGRDILEIIPADTEKILRKWGILLVTNIGARTPPFIETVRSGSRAAELGLQPDDLIVMVNNRIAPSRNSVEQQILATEKGKPITLTIERNMELLDVVFHNE